MSVNRRKVKVNIADILIYTFVILVSAFCLLPIIYVFSVSLTDPSVYVPLEFRLIPKKISFKVYSSIMSTPDFVTAIKNTVIITVGGTFMSILATFSFAYGLIKKDLPFRKLFMFFVVFALLFDVGLIPNYLTVRKLGLINTYWSLILPSLLTSWNVIVAKSFLQAIPEELEESAKIDGCSYFGSFFKIILPLSTASIATLTLFIAVGQWNMYTKPLMYITDYKMRTLQVYIKTMLIDASTTGTGVGDGNMVMPSETIRLATIVLSMFPIMCVYPFVQRYFVKGVMLGSVKG
jgi:putative aldouronate transport system permease protein